ncbi:hypothetical protein CEV32_1639 [Brucella rhizosphaerae]|uniref:Uncharacterized protein n=1 Tax=Brucella rhizosphaerae TaxID=571254 RepID=A0A256FA84_9HYPH|nr:hypothetical protein CEV32_1639 [Brucella rhizosphaerae]
MFKQIEMRSNMRILANFSGFDSHSETKASLFIATFFDQFCVIIGKVNSYCFRFTFILFRIVLFEDYIENAQDGTKLLGMPETSSCIKLV